MKNKNLSEKGVVVQKKDTLNVTKGDVGLNPTNSIIVELRKKNPYERLKLEKSESVCYCYDNGYNKAVDELERMLKVKK